MGFAKVLVIGILGLLITCGLIIQKTSFIYFLSLYSSQQIQHHTWYAGCFLVLAVPEVIGTITALWNMSFLAKTKKVKWPPVLAVLTLVVLTILEGVALIIFVVWFGVMLPASVLLPIMGTVMLTKMARHLSAKEETVIFQTTSEVVKKRFLSSKKLKTIAQILLTILVIITVPVLLRLAEILKEWSHCALLSGCLIVLSLTWNSSMQLYTRGALQSDNATKDLNSRNIINLLKSVMKLFTYFIGFAFVIMLKQQDSYSFSNSFVYLFSGFSSLGHPSIGPLVLSLTLVPVLTYLLILFSLALCIPFVSLTLPSFLSTPLAVTLTYFVCWESHLVRCSHMIPDSGFVYASIALAFLGWLIPFVLYHRNLNKSAHTLLSSPRALFQYNTYCSIFLDQHLQLTYFPRSSESDDESEIKTKKQTLIFVCTTMYREADYEMSRLLQSLQGLANSKLFFPENVTMEAHVFLDDGIRESCLQEFGVQLLSLAESVLGISRDGWRVLGTPYGAQLSTPLSSTMPLFLHLKDPSKVKTKKRWSQILYMKYILDFRLKTDLCLNTKQPDIFTLSNNAGDIVLRNPYRQSVQLPIYKDTLRALSTELLLDSDENDLYRLDGAISLSSYRGSSDNLSSYSEITTDTLTENITIPRNNTDTTLDRFSIGTLESGYRTEGISTIDTESMKSQGPVSATNVMQYPSTHIASVQDIDSYILATDADMVFSDRSVVRLLEICRKDTSLGGCCGRSYPVGMKWGPLVWFQMFEYAKDFWMIKSAQNVIGSVMCCPGCFSLYRTAAISDVIGTYHEPTYNAIDTFNKDTGEDRWVCTLMMLRGWRLAYSAASGNTTYCPDKWSEFLKQRRRWILSDLVNSFIVIKKFPTLIRENNRFTIVYCFYLLQLVVTSLLTTGAVSVMITAGLDMIFDISLVYTSPVLVAMLLVYGWICITRPEYIQTYATIVLTVILSVALNAVVVGLVYQSVREYAYGIGVDVTVAASMLNTVQRTVLLILIGTVFYSALLHPRQMFLLLHGVFYALLFPANHVLVPIYSLCNIVDQSWGTRDQQKAKFPKLFRLPKRIKRNKKAKGGNKTNDIPKHDEAYEMDMQPMETAESSHVGEYEFWRELRETVVGVKVNLGASHETITDGLKKIRIIAVLIFGTANIAIVIGFCVLFEIFKNNNSLGMYGMALITFYGFALAIQVLGMTIYRLKVFVWYVSSWFRPRLQEHYEENVL